MIGKWFEFYEDGEVKLTSFYDSLGRKDSLWSYYSSKDVVIKREVYKHDSLLSVDSLKK
jgi:antitoxin component YwqK of YwqJK toxin-antitoxin module